MRPFTYQVPPGGADSAGLEGFLVYPADADEPVGKVGIVLEREGRRFLVIELDGLPTRPDRRFVSWEAVDAVDAGSLTVRLSIPASEREQAPARDADRQTEDDGAEAKRVVDLPELAGTTAPESGPADRPITFLPLVTGALMAFTLLGTLALYATTGKAWVFAFLALPVGLAAATCVALYSAARRPYERR